MTLGAAVAVQDLTVRERKEGKKTSLTTQDYMRADLLTCLAPHEEDANTEEHVGDVTLGERLGQVL